MTISILVTIGLIFRRYQGGITAQIRKDAGMWIVGASFQFLSKRTWICIRGKIIQTVVIDQDEFKWYVLGVFRIGSLGFKSNSLKGTCLLFNGKMEK
jgi:hypothetical protein